MTDPNSENPDSVEAEAMGEKPDTGRQPDTLIDALSGSGMGSDTRAGSLRGGSASGSDIDPDQDTIDDALAEEGAEMKDETSPASDT